MRFTYQAKAGPGAIRSGVIEADNRSLVIARLKREGLFPLEVRESAPDQVVRDRKIPSSDISAFTRQLSDLLNSGFTLSAALGTLAAQARTPALGRLIGQLREGIEQGNEFSHILSLHPSSFPVFYVSMVRIGEAGGRLEDSLKRLADFREREDEFLAQLRSALVYPAFLFFVGMVTIFVLSAFFIPRLARMFADFEQVLPLSTRIIIFAGSILGRFWWLFLMLAGFGVFLLKSALASERNRLALDTAFLRMPFLNDIIRKLEAARFSYALGVLLKSGIPILEGLGVARLNVANRRMRTMLGAFPEKVRKGQSLSNCLNGEKKLFPEMLYRMAAVGEESGELADMLLRAAVVFENDVNRSLKQVVSLLEPCLVLFLGGFMILIVFSILLPIFQLDFFPK